MKKSVAEPKAVKQNGSPMSIQSDIRSRATKQNGSPHAGVMAAPILENQNGYSQEPK